MAIGCTANMGREQENLVSSSALKQSGVLEKDFASLNLASRSLVVRGEGVRQQQIPHKDLRGTRLDPMGVDIEVRRVCVNVSLGEKVVRE